MAHFVQRLARGYRRRPIRSNWISEKICWPVRKHSSRACPSNHMKVAILGASGRTGRSLALCLKQSILVDELAIYDSMPIHGLLMELSHMATRCKTLRDKDGKDSGTGDIGIRDALEGAKIVAIAIEKVHFNDEVTMIKKLAPSLICCCPKAFVALVSRKANSLLPMLFELYKQAGVFAGGRLFGVMNLYTTRANKFAAEVLGIDPEYVTVPVIGGASSRTCVPLFSQTRPCSKFTPDEVFGLTRLLRNSETMITNAYGTDEFLSPVCAGFSAARFCVSLCKALKDERGVVECAYTRSCLLPELKYFGAPLELGPTGIQRHLGLPRISSTECNALHEIIPEIKKSIVMGEHLALGNRESTEICSVQPCPSALQPYHSDVTA